MGTLISESPTFCNSACDLDEWRTRPRRLQAGEFLPTLAKGCADENSGVRRTAISAMGRVVAAEPRHFGELQPVPAKECTDEEWSGGSTSVFDVVAWVAVAKAPPFAGEFS